MSVCSYTPVTAGHSTSKAKGSQGMHELKIKCFVSKGMHGHSMLVICGTLNKCSFLIFHPLFINTIFSLKKGCLYKLHLQSPLLYGVSPSPPSFPAPPVSLSPSSSTCHFSCACLGKHSWKFWKFNCYPTASFMEHHPSLQWIQWILDPLFNPGEPLPDQHIST